MSLEIRDPRVRDIVGAEVAIEQLATGIGFGEGPVWDQAGKRLVFSDMKQDPMRSWRAGEGRPDGMKLDSAGNLYCTGPGGVHVLDPQGRSLGVLRTPERVTNIAWGDDDLKSLYVTGITALYRVRVTVPGQLTY